MWYKQEFIHSKEQCVGLSWMSELMTLFKAELNTVIIN